MQQSANQPESKPLLNNWRGVVLMALGGLFLWLNLNPTAAENWWSIFILLPGLLFVGGAVMMGMRSNGRFKPLSRSLFGIGAIVLTVAGMFFLDLSWTQWWPLMVMVPGAAIWFSSPAPAQPEQALAGTAVAGMGRWIGLTTTLLGATFLLDQLNLISLTELWGNHHWWGWFILIPAVGAFILALQIRQLNRNSIAVPIMLIVGILIGGTAVRELLNLTWHQFELFGSLCLIGGGFVLLLANLRRN